MRSGTNSFAVHKTPGVKSLTDAPEKAMTNLYELNIALYDLLQGTFDGPESRLGYERYICAHTIMLALEGIPAIYIQSFLGGSAMIWPAEHTGRNRLSIVRSGKRKIWKTNWGPGRLCMRAFFANWHDF